MVRYAPSQGRTPAVPESAADAGAPAWPPDEPGAARDAAARLRHRDRHGGDRLTRRGLGGYRPRDLRHGGGAADPVEVPGDSRGAAARAPQPVGITAAGWADAGPAGR